MAVPAATASSGGDGNAADGSCIVCGSDSVRECQVDTRRESPSSRTVRGCQACGFHALSDVIETLANRTPGVRHGSAERPGRDFALALLAAEVIDRARLDVLMWEPGVSADLDRIARVPLVRSVTIATEGSVIPPDGASVREIRELQAGESAYDIVIGNEVVQMLRSPVEGLTALLKSAGPTGLVVLSTDLYDGSDLGGLAFPRNMAHRWYWSARSLMTVAESAGLTVDVRVPEIAVRKKYLRKRYVFASQDRDVMARVRRRFGSQLHAPSEVLP